MPGETAGGRLGLGQMRQVGTGPGPGPDWQGLHTSHFTSLGVFQH